MKLKEQTFAVIAEKKGSISHEWFVKNCLDTVQWGGKGYYYVYARGNYIIPLNKPTDIPIYRESEFEELIKQEESEHFDQVLQKGIDNSRLNKEEREENKLENSASNGNIFPIYKTVVPANAGGTKETFMAQPSEITPLTVKDTQPPPIINIVLSKHYVDKIIREDLTKQGIKIGEESKIEIV
jgi:hypothetical protein